MSRSYEDYKALDARVMKRDNFVGIVGEDSDSYILVQGNVPNEVVEYAQMLKTFFEYDRQPEDSTANDKGVRCKNAACQDAVCGPTWAFF